MKRQYGVQLVWDDPVKAGAVKPGEDYTPKWDHFDSVAQADKFANIFIPSIGLDDYTGGIKAVNRAVRWAVEDYTEWEITYECP